MFSISHVTLIKEQNTNGRTTYYCIYNISYSLVSEHKQSSSNQYVFFPKSVHISVRISRNLLSLEYSSSCLVVPYWTSDLAAADPLKSNKTMRTINKSSQKSK